MRGWEEEEMNDKKMVKWKWPEGDMGESREGDKFAEIDITDWEVSCCIFNKHYISISKIMYFHKIYNIH
jgi:hypothetical protein